MELNRKNYHSNDYLDGTCPGCGEWEAPITSEELVTIDDPIAHHGSSTPVRDLDARRYVRQKWREYFQCPKCNKRFSVLYSNV